MSIHSTTKSKAAGLKINPGGETVLRRKCSCGGAGGTHGECYECRKKREASLHRKAAGGIQQGAHFDRLFSNVSCRLRAGLVINNPRDPFEQEADRVAEAVVSDYGGTVRPASLATSLQRTATQDSGGAGSAPPIVHEVLSESGQALDPTTRRFMESRFGCDFSHVRVHTDVKAAESARAVQARAYTVGSNIIFGRGQYAPGSSPGQRLLAHELTHVTQQAGGLLQRSPDPDAVKEFDDRVAKLRARPEFVRAAKNPDPKRETKKELEEIMKEARKRDEALYYIEKLELLFDTIEVKAEAQAEETSKKISGEAGGESTRLGTDAGKARKDVEEGVTKEATRVWTEYEGEGGKIFFMDARDVTNIAVRIKVRLVAKGKGKATDVTNVKKLEDAIEKNASTLGYSVDLDFVDKSGPDVFTVGVDTSGWPTSGNWVAEARGLAHELHHLLGLDDLYDYIKVHATNPRMKVTERIHWFREQLDKTPDLEAGKSIMGRSITGGRNLPSDQDVCRVTGAGGTDFDTCVKKRSDARRDKLQPAISSAFGTTNRAFELLADLKPLGPADDPVLKDLKKRRAQLMAENIFGTPVSMPAVKDAIGDMRLAFALPNLFLVSELNPQCPLTAFTVPMAPRIRLCPAFLDLGTNAQANLLLREAAHVVGVSNAASDAPCPTKTCSDACGNSKNGEAWVRLVKCVARI